MKRIFDLCLVVPGILLVLPIIIIIGILIRVFDGKPSFFAQERVGRHGRIFRIIKFRTMVPGAEKMAGGSITSRVDPRITNFGAFLRRWKIDELPSLWNVLTGDMGMVGPRPDVPGFADALQGEECRILDIRPGITGPSTLRFADEEVILANEDDPDKYNREVIFPEKVRINLEYMDNWTLFGDAKIILRTIFRRNY